MTELYKASFHLDEKVLEKYGAVLNADADQLKKAYQNFKEKGKKIEKDKFLSDSEFEHFSDDCARLFKNLSSYNRRYTKEMSFLKLIIDLLNDRKVSSFLSLFFLGNNFLFQIEAIPR